MAKVSLRCFCQELEYLLALKKSIADANPNIAKVLNPIADALDTATIQDLNTQVDIAGKQPADVAKTWLQSKGFIGK